MLLGWGVESWEKQWSWAWERGEERWYFNVCGIVSLHLHLFYFAVSKFHQGMSVLPAFPATVLDKQSPCLYLNPQAFSFLFLLISPYPAERRERVRAWEGVWLLAKANPPPWAGGLMSNCASLTLEQRWALQLWAAAAAKLPHLNDQCSSLRLSAGFTSPPAWVSSMLRGFLVRAACLFSLFLLTTNTEYFQQCLNLLAFPYGVLPCMCRHCISSRGLMLDAEGRLMGFCTCK